MPLHVFLIKHQNIGKYTKKIFEILVLTALTVGLIWTLLELIPKSVLLSLSMLQFKEFHF